MARISDIVRVMDRGIANLRSRAGEIIGGRKWGDGDSVVEVQGWVKLLMRERGKIVPGSHREGHNIWTNTGREYLALLMSIASAPSTGFRSDKIAYIGVGTGAQVEEAGVLRLITPVAYVTGQFLAPLDVPPTFPLTPTRTTVRYHRIFAEDQITLTPGSTVTSVRSECSPTDGSRTMPSVSETQRSLRLQISLRRRTSRSSRWGRKTLSSSKCPGKSVSEEKLDGSDGLLP
jgi:hypothetical protein